MRNYAGKRVGWGSAELREFSRSFSPSRGCDYTIGKEFLKFSKLLEQACSRSREFVSVAPAPRLWGNYGTALSETLGARGEKLTPLMTPTSLLSTRVAVRNPSIWQGFRSGTTWGNEWDLRVTAGTGHMRTQSRRSTKNENASTPGGYSICTSMPAPITSATPKPPPHS